mgnify:CR=1 FL=1
MELKIIQEKENPLFKRKEILAEINSEITPKIIEIESILSREFSKPAENIKIKRIKGKFGTKFFNIEANIYELMEDKEKTEIKTQKQRNAEKKARMEGSKKSVVEENKSGEVVE